MHLKYEVEKARAADENDDDLDKVTEQLEVGVIMVGAQEGAQ